MNEGYAPGTIVVKVRQDNMEVVAIGRPTADSEHRFWTVSSSHSCGLEAVGKKHVSTEFNPVLHLASCITSLNAPVKVLVNGFVIEMPVLEEGRK